MRHGVGIEGLGTRAGAQATSGCGFAACPSLAQIPSTAPVSSGTVVLNRGGCIPQGTFCNIWRLFWLPPLGLREEGRYATGIWDAGKHPPMHGTVSPSKSYPAPNVRRPKTEKPCLRVKPPHAMSSSAAPAFQAAPRPHATGPGRDTPHRSLPVPLLAQPSALPSTYLKLTSLHLLPPAGTLPRCPRRGGTASPISPAAAEVAKGETEGSQSRHPLRRPGSQAVELAPPRGQGPSHQEGRISTPPPTPTLGWTPGGKPRTDLGQPPEGS